ncbi:hypothetical protein EMIHUDRAFT_118269 [Emiliania huxleyi CCMP1516]|uniref:S1 motif domain-containing protein n=2 Tax=Emiliania huxleyi TaxID=2903 RepID=A0A0D3J629_EMIH1|nr:hypothetical protein EMIHUDRAFT_118269 [Emiliania huxleyi CCMP1516]EOD18964.1 hypothetical protein EMIHUDRAFT_118269 [Emiliania huxleyi CCMP1516]|eukprot:XP_005771393.1 hypothetical protein EMIHUDRAFT_118269 [Emiliania huxleyi CCMP1516]
MPRSPSSSSVSSLSKTGSDFDGKTDGRAKTDGPAKTDAFGRARRGGDRSPSGSPPRRRRDERERSRSRGRRGRVRSRSPEPRRRGGSPPRARERDGHRGGGGDPRDDGPLPELESVHRAEVVRVEAYGAFVALSGFRRQGLVHISQLASWRVESVEEVARVGQRVYVLVLSTDNGRLSCSMRRVDQESGAARPDEPRGPGASFAGGAYSAADQTYPDRSGAQMGLNPLDRQAGDEAAEPRRGYGGGFDPEREARFAEARQRRAILDMMSSTMPATRRGMYGALADSFAMPPALLMIFVSCASRISSCFWSTFATGAVGSWVSALNAAATVGLRTRRVALWQVTGQAWFDLCESS